MKQTFKLNLLTFPLWWYTTGFGITWAWCQQSYRYALKKSAFGLFIRYIRSPLYGDYTRSGRIISFGIRIVLLLVKVAGLGFRLFGFAVAIMLHLVIVPLSLLMAIYSIIPF